MPPNAAAELLAFRTVLDQVNSTHRSASDAKVVSEMVVSFAEKLEKGIHDLQRTLDDARPATCVGTPDSLSRLRAPAFWATTMVAAGYAADIAKLPLHLAAAGTGIAGAIQVSKYLVDMRHERRAKDSDSPFAHLYHAQQAGIA